MQRRERSSVLLLAGLWVSLGFHALVGMGFVRYSDALVVLRKDHRADKPIPIPPKPVPPPQPAPKPPEIKLGIAKSDTHTMTWLGYESPTEHLAPRGKTEQSAMAIAAPGPAKAAAPGAQENPAPPAPPRPAVNPAMREQIRQSAQAVAGAIAAARQRLAQVAQELTRKETPGTPTAKAPQAPSEPPKPEPTPSPPAAAAKGGGGGTPGALANKESTPISVKDAPTVRPGQVAAAQGLEIRTVEPRWSTVTLMTRRPRNPTVLITFWRDGTVKEVQWAREGDKVYDTGSTEVNQPLLTALYAWTATGKPLEELDPKDPGACLTIMIRVILQ